MPPIETALWLLKPPRLIRSTCPHPQEAANWLGQQLTAHAPRFASPHDSHTRWLAALNTSTTEQLTRGSDVSLGFYLRGALFLSVALVTCTPNRTKPELPCPLR
ncbi:hypothetical protein ACMA1D_28265 [Streptomyces sp. 796.1]|uniref:hypothetical protein n=1 Tax=Streptomyces sp. 796.1 TaxID=3163029 RepID=UPI0039C8E0FC